MKKIAQGIFLAALIISASLLHPQEPESAKQYRRSQPNEPLWPHIRRVSRRSRPRHPNTPAPEPTTVEPPEASEPASKPKTYNGITEGDVIIGELTHYDVCVSCCGKTDGVTASGLVIWNGMDDPRIVGCNWLPFGAVVEFSGLQYTVADRGGKNLDSIGRLDVYTPDGNQAALQLGRVSDVEITVVSLP